MTTDDLALEVAAMRAELLRQQEDARKKVYRGIVMIALVPLVIILSLLVALQFGGLALLVALLSGAAYTLIGSVGGIVMIGSGAVEHRRVGKQLHDYEHVRRLPEARIVVR
jgi:hypothetical protein